PPIPTLFPYTTLFLSNGTVFGQGAYTTNRYRTFTTDAYGNDLVQDAYYTVRVTAYDVANNGTSSTVRLQYKVARPSNWTWHSSKTSGSVVNLTAAEWNSFVIRINQFRMYKSLSNYSFTTVSSGNPIRASQLNEARSAIASMTSVPSSAVSGATATASFINALSNSLNAVA